MWQRIPYWKISIIVFVMLLSLWQLMPTLEFYSHDPLVRNLGVTPEMRELEQKIGQGPSNVQELRDRYNDLKAEFREIRGESIRLGLDLQGGVHLAIAVDLEQYRQDLLDMGKSQEEIDYAMETVLDSAAAVIENRVDQFGVAETALVKQPPNRLILEMPGFSNPDEVRNLVQAEARLYFHLVAPEPDLIDIIGDIDAVVDDDLGSLMMTVPGMGAVVVEDPDNVDTVENILARPEIQSIVGNRYTFRWGGLKEPTAYYNFPHRYLYLLYAKEELSGANLETAWVYINPVNNQPEVALRFDAQGSRTFRRVTGDNVGEPLAIVLEDRVFSAPTIQGEIPNGNANITGIGDFTEARQIAVVLRAGALPAPLEIAESRVVGPSLGRDSITNGLYAGLIGGLIVLVFMAGYYAMTGLVADAAVLLNLFLLTAGMAMFKATLTLPGIAGIVLTVGMAVDANVLIFERIREELSGKRAKTMQMVIDRAYGRAFMTIFDANLTTLITALVLFQFGTGPIKGFAVTLSLGILISMFTAVFVSRVILDTMIGLGYKNISAGTFRFFSTPNFDFLGKYKPYLVSTLGVGLAGFVFLAVNWNHFKGIDFAGGTEMEVQFAEPLPPQQIREGLASAGIAETVVQEVYGEENQMLIRVREGAVADTAELVDKVEQAAAGTPFEVMQTGNVSAKVGNELLLKGLYCILFSSVGILLYITARFEFRFAVAAVAALFHDLLFTLAILAFTGTEFNLPIIAALLTVLGYSLNDTIVVFDRIRENHASAALNFKETVNHSINQTLTRTLNTSMTTLFVIATLYLVGGAVIHDFAFTLMVGVLIGTYSSIFIASPILIMMGQPAPETREERERRESAMDTRSSGVFGN